MGVTVVQEHGHFGAQARTVPQQPGQSSALLSNGTAPATATLPALGLIAPLQEMHDEDLKAMLQFPPVPFPQRLELLREVAIVKFAPLLSPQQGCLLLRPGIEVVIIERGGRSHGAFLMGLSFIVREVFLLRHVIYLSQCDLGLG
jgi:hypothetical protein